MPRPDVSEEHPVCQDLALSGARQLYERLGFRVIRTERYPLPRNWLGFSGEHVMVKVL